MFFVLTINVLRRAEYINLFAVACSSSIVRFSVYVEGSYVRRFDLPSSLLKVQLLIAFLLVYDLRSMNNIKHFFTSKICTWAHCTHFCCTYDCQLFLSFCGDWICLCMVQFKTFSERIEDVDIDVYRNLDPLKAEPTEGSSFFRDCITEWRVRTFIMLFEVFLYLLCKNCWIFS